MEINLAMRWTNFWTWKFWIAIRWFITAVVVGVVVGIVVVIVDAIRWSVTVVIVVVVIRAVSSSVWFFSMRNKFNCPFSMTANTNNNNYYYYY